MTTSTHNASERSSTTIMTDLLSSTSKLIESMVSIHTLFGHLYTAILSIIVLWSLLDDGITYAKFLKVSSMLLLTPLAVYIPLQVSKQPNGTSRPTSIRTPSSHSSKTSSPKLDHTTIQKRVARINKPRPVSTIETHHEPSISSPTRRFSMCPSQRSHASEKRRSSIFARPPRRQSGDSQAGNGTVPMMKRNSSIGSESGKSNQDCNSSISNESTVASSMSKTKKIAKIKKLFKRNRGLSL